MRQDDRVPTPATRRLRHALVVAAALPAAVVSVAALRVHVIARRSVESTDPVGHTVVVFGALALAEGPGRILRARLDHGLGLYRRHPGRKLAVAGGIPPFTDAPSGGHDEVAAMVAYAREHGVPDADLIEVRPGQDTREQVRSTRRIVVEAGLGPVIAVSSSYHLARIADEASRLGFSVATSAPRSSPDVDSPRVYLSHVLVDALATIWYAIPDGVRARLPLDTGAGSFRHLGLMAATGDTTWRTALESLSRQRTQAGTNSSAS